MAKKTGSARKKVVNVEPAGQAHIHASFNNIIISLPIIRTGYFLVISRKNGI